MDKDLVLTIVVALGIIALLCIGLILFCGPPV